MKAQVIKLILFSFGLLVTSTTFACTDFRLSAKDGTVLVSRTMEFAMDMKANLRNSPRGREITSKAPSGDAGLTWKAKYGYLFIDAFEQDIAVDGMNEAGLSFEALYLPGETQYPTLPTGKEAQSLPYFQLGDWVLGNFKTVDEVKKALADVYVYQAFFPGNVPGLSTMIFPLHVSIYEASGKGIIVEFVGGKVNVYDSIGILTNSPPYDWQVANLRNYLNLSPYVPKSVMVDGISYSATGQGSGSVGLPGDPSPPSRFAKIAFLTTAAFQATNKTDVLNLAQHIINNVDIPLGLARSVDNGKDSTDYTQWTVFKDLTHKVMYYRTYNDLTLRSVDMTKIDLSENAKPMKMPLTNTPYTMDMTAKFSNQPQTNGHTVAKVNAASKINAKLDDVLEEQEPKINVPVKKVVPKVDSQPHAAVKNATSTKWGLLATAPVNATTNAVKWGLMAITPVTTPTTTPKKAIVATTVNKVKTAIKTSAKNPTSTTKTDATLKIKTAKVKTAAKETKPVNATSNKN